VFTDLTINVFKTVDEKLQGKIYFRKHIYVLKPKGSQINWWWSSGLCWTIRTSESCDGWKIISSVPVQSGRYLPQFEDIILCSTTTKIIKLAGRDCYRLFACLLGVLFILKTESASSSETSVKSNQNTRCHVLEDSIIHSNIVTFRKMWEISCQPDHLRALYYACDLG
jgi:hypothetical protein